jgi:tetratricopeptide (TPR) repeat protein
MKNFGLPVIKEEHKMKRIGYVGVWLAILFALEAQLHAEQSQDSRALKWLEIGIREKSLEKKIEAYTKAIELDPLFVEALFNLGKAYKDQRDFQRAEHYLLKAYSATPEKTTADLKLAILYELATAYHRLGKFRNYEETLRQAKAFTSDGKMAATLGFELGRALYQQGRYQEALEELRAGQKHDPDHGNSFANLIQLTETALEQRQLYATAEQAKASGNLKQARDLLEQIKVKNPNDKGVEAKIAELDLLLNEQTKKQNEAALYRQAQQYERDGNFAMAIATYESLLKQSASYQDASARLQKVREQLVQKQRLEMMESEYAMGLARLEARDWAGAAISFEKVLQQDSNFREARLRLQDAQRRLQRENAEAMMTRYYAEGVSAMSQKQYSVALTAFEKVRQVNPNYRDVASLLAEIASALEQKAEVTEAPSSSAVNLDSLYKQALALQATGDWFQAAITFEKLQILQPNFRDVVDRLAFVRTSLNQTRASEVVPAAPLRNNSSLIALGAVIAAAIVLFWLGFMMFSPGVRARYYSFRGNYAAAAEIYERLLANNPRRVKLYSTLANIYLLLGRHDEQALRAYKMVLRLNLAEDKREEMNSIVAQNFLSEGRTDSEAIQVLESELQDRRRIRPPAAR